MVLWDSDSGLPSSAGSIQRSVQTIGRDVSGARRIATKLLYALRAAPAVEPAILANVERLARLEEHVAAELAKLSKHLATGESEVQALRQARSAAEGAHRRTTELLAAASHDLLQPLSAARIFLATLGRARFRPQNQALIDRADSALASAESLLGSLLEISAIDAGGIRPEVTSFPISSLLITLASEFEPLAGRKGLALNVILSTTRVQSDIRLLRRIVQNLMSNAVRYTQEGRVLVGCRRRPEGLRIEIWDTGRGIAADKIDRIFEEFQRLESGGGERDPGMGLGLSIVRRLADVLDHPVAVCSQPGRGSMFAVTARYGRAMPALRPSDLPPAVNPRRLAGKIVVVVENDEPVREALAALLRSWACHPVTSGSTDEALAALAAGRLAPNLVIADYHLGSAEDGLDVIDAMRLAYGERLPALLVSADTASGLRKAAGRSGCELLAKPIRPPELAILVRRLML